MAKGGPGKYKREGITVLELATLFPNEKAAKKWFEFVVWPDGRFCPKCGSVNTYKCKHAKSPYRCRDCKRYFSVKSGTVLEDSKIPLQKWVYAIYLEVTSLKGISSMKLHRDIGVTQKTAWFMLHRIREAWKTQESGMFYGPVEADETFIGGKKRNMSKAKRKELAKQKKIRPDKEIVVGIRGRKTKKVNVTIAKYRDARTLQKFVRKNIKQGSMVYTDGAAQYIGIKGVDHESVNHSVGEYVRGMAHTNGIESFWSMLKRSYTGTYHKISPKHLKRYVKQFAGKHNMRELDTMEQMMLVVGMLIGKRLMYTKLTRDNGKSSHARSY